MRLVCVMGLTTAVKILYVVTDDQDQMLGGSFPSEQTPMPKTAKIASESLVFTNFFVHVPICNPSRSTTLTGRYFHNIKTTNTSWAAMHVDMDLVHNFSFAASLPMATALFGKYANAMPSYKPRGWDVFFANDGGAYMNASFGDVETIGYSTAVIANKSIEWIKNQTGDWFCYVAPKAAHEPFDPAPWYADVWNDSWTQIKGPAYNLSYAARAQHGSNVPTQPMISTRMGEIITGIFKNRWRTLMSVDDAIAGLVEAAGDAYFFYTSDHGFQLGQLNIPMDKRHVYDWNTRVHLLVKGPGIQPGFEARLATNVDLAPTFLELAGVHKETDGMSLVPLFKGPAEWRTSLLIEYYFNDPNEKCVENCTAPHDTYPVNDSYCVDLTTFPNQQCWGPPGCNEDCYPTESSLNNFIALRVINDTSNLLYVEYQSGNQAKVDINFSNISFTELFDAAQDPWMLNNLYSAPGLHSLLHQWFACAGPTCII